MLIITGKESFISKLEYLQMPKENYAQEYLVK